MFLLQENGFYCLLTIRLPSLLININPKPHIKGSQRGIFPSKKSPFQYCSLYIKSPPNSNNNPNKVPIKKSHHSFLKYLTLKTAKSNVKSIMLNKISFFVIKKKTGSINNGKSSSAIFLSKVVFFILFF